MKKLLLVLCLSTMLSSPAFAGGVFTSMSGTDKMQLYYDANGNVGIGTTAPVALLSVAGATKARMFVPANNVSIGTTTNLTIANMDASSFFPVSTTGGAFTVTMFSDAADNGIPAGEVGRSFKFAITAGGTNALTLAIDSDLTLTMNDAITASSNTIEDVGDYIDCFVNTTDNVVCTSFEKD